MSEISATTEYSFNSINHIRQRPGMYIAGGIDVWGLHYLLYEVIDNVIDQAQLGKCTHLWITVHAGNSVTVRDDGPGIPVAIYEGYGSPILELILTKAVGKFNAQTQQFINTSFGVGLAAVNALSASLHIQVARDGFLWQQEYHVGKPEGPLEKLRPLAAGEPTGTAITLTPDFTIFKPHNFQFSILEERCRDLAYLASGLSITLRDERYEPASESTFYSEHGLLDCVAYFCGSNLPAHETIHIKRDVEFKRQGERPSMIQIELAAQYMTATLPIEESFASRFKLRRGQSHMWWLHTAFLEFMNKYAYEHGILTEGDSEFTRKEALAGLITVVNITNLYPEQPHQGTCDLPYRELRQIMYNFAMDALATFNRQYPQQTRMIADWLVSRRYDT